MSSKNILLTFFIEIKPSFNFFFMTVDEHYDAFISYAVADRDFAKMILSKLETDYNLKVCIDFRDFLPGAHKLEQIVEVIEDRCNKVIVILSEDYLQCEDCDHQAKVAMSLSPGELFI